MSVGNFYSQISDWSNNNQGILAIGIFVATIFLGWISGIFSALRRKPKFSIDLIPGPTLTCTFGIGKRYNEFDVHRTGIALYIQISNVGSAPGSIKDIHVSYHWSIRPFSIQWVRNRLGWHTLTEQTVVATDFQASLGPENTKIYPFLTQRSVISGDSANGYLDVGMITNGVVYFEQSDSWGGCFPHSKNKNVKVKVTVLDSFGKRHSKKFWIPKTNLIGARKYNPSFGTTLASLSQDDDLIDLDVDEHGNIIP